eukprot:GILI01016286.1.p1 GENE.GILI01016286.1~~GILI01016286.1.p1  ORF type:complete len:269 (-),score=62.88 GILI01016286.1:162-968(-)
MNTSTETFRERTNANQFQQRQRLPPNFSVVLKEYTREVLRVQPEDIFAWSAQYFKDLALESEPMLAQQPPPGHYKAEVEDPESEVVAMKISKSFAALDQQQKGRLFVDLVKRVLMESIQLTNEQALFILSSEYATIGDDATIDYRQLARDCVQAVLYFTQNEFQFPEVFHDEEEPTVHGRVREDIEGTLMRAAAEADADGLGRISYHDYTVVLENAPIDLTRRDIKLLQSEAAITRDGTIDIRAEVAGAFDRLLLAAKLTAFDEQNSG